MLIVAAQPAGVGGDNRAVDAAGTGGLVQAYLPDNGLGRVVFIRVSHSCAAGRCLGDLLFLGVAQAVVVQAPGGDAAVGGVEPGWLHAVHRFPVRCEHGVCVIRAAAVKGVGVAQPCDFLDVHGDASGVGPGLPHTGGCSGTAPNHLKGEHVRRVQAGGTRYRFIRQGGVSFFGNGFSLCFCRCIFRSLFRLLDVAFRRSFFKIGTVFV